MGLPLENACPKKVNTLDPNRNQGRLSNEFSRQLSFKAILPNRTQTDTVVCKRYTPKQACGMHLETSAPWQDINTRLSVVVIGAGLASSNRSANQSCN